MHPFSKTVAAQSLPFDIIQEIFSHYSTTLLIYSDGNWPNVGFPWFLGHVCTSWRTVFLSMYAEFWSSLIMFPNAPLSTADGKRGLDIVTTFMERTKGLPISLSLHLRHMPRPIIDIFIKHCKQWQHVELIFEQKQLSLLSSVKDQLPLLCSLRLGFSHPTPLLTDSPEPIVLFENAPRLTHVRLQHLWRWRFHWPSLSTLALQSHIEVDMLLETLSQLENLETTLHIMQRDIFDATINPSMSITMTRLKVLRTNGSTILTFLTAPSLEVLHIGMCSDWRYFSRVCSAFFGKSECRLLRLSIRSCDTQSLAAILPFVPTIETLYVGCDFDYHISFPIDFFHALASPPGEPLKLPELRTMRFSMLSPITEDDVTALRSMITLRRLGPHPKMREILILPCQEEFWEVQDRVLKMLERLGQECEIQGIQLIIKPISYDDLETPFYDGNRHYFGIHFTTKLY